MVISFGEKENNCFFFSILTLSGTLPLKGLSWPGTVQQYHKILYKIYIIKPVLARYCPTNVVSVLIFPISVSFTDTSSPRFQGGIWQPSKMNKLFKGVSNESV